MCFLLADGVCVCACVCVCVVCVCGSFAAKGEMEV